MIKVALNGRKIRVEAEMIDGRLQERYLSKTVGDVWVEVANSDQVIGLYGSEKSSDGNSGFSFSKRIQVRATKIFTSEDRAPVLMFRNVKSSAGYDLTINGVARGIYKEADLEKGIPVPLK